MGCAVGRKIKKESKKTAKPLLRKPKRTVFIDDFEYTDNGHIQGNYTVDGFFEPD